MARRALARPAATGAAAPSRTGAAAPGRSNASASSTTTTSNAASASATAVGVPATSATAVGVLATSSGSSPFALAGEFAGWIDYLHEHRALDGFAFLRWRGHDAGKRPRERNALHPTAK